MKAVEKGKGSKGRVEGVRPPGGCSAVGQVDALQVRRTVSGRKVARWHDYEVKRRAVRLYLEESVPAVIVAEELGITHSTVHDWVRQYREHGEEGLHPQYPSRRGGKSTSATGKPNAHALIRGEIAVLKKRHPAFGVRRIAQTLRRIFHLPASPETVRRTLHREKLITPAKKKTPSNPSKPRFFERATPNQMWQSDIFPFKLGGEAVRPPEWLGPGGYAYLIGFIDDHSRYITALEVFRSQTAENVLEVFRRGMGAHGVPKEMLTDNGRQYASWHGKTKFQQELEKNRIHHIRSAPHHPQTLGKIERFWKTIYTEFLSNARFSTFEEARERIRWWVQYYNHKRPHQSLEGLCPADRFYKIQVQVRSEIEKGIVANVRELALHGKPQTPFYMVGRMGEQSVTIKTEEGQVKLVVEKAEGIGDEHSERGGKAKENKETGECAIEGAGGAVGMVGPQERLSGVPGAGCELGLAARVGTQGDAGDTQGSRRGATGSVLAERAGEAAGRAPGGTNGAVAAGGTGRESGVKGDCEIKENDYAHEREEEIRSYGAVPGGSAAVVGTQECGGDLQGAEDRRESSGALAGEGHGGADLIAEPAGRAGSGGEGSGAVGTTQAAPGEEIRGTGRPETSAGASGGAGEEPGACANDGGIEAYDTERRAVVGRDAVADARSERGANCCGGGATDGSIQEDVLRAGAADGAGCEELAGAQERRTVPDGAGHGEGDAPGADTATGAGEAHATAAHAGAGAPATNAG